MNKLEKLSERIRGLVPRAKSVLIDEQETINESYDGITHQITRATGMQNLYEPPITLEDVLEALTTYIVPENEEEGGSFNHDITTLVRGFWNVKWQYGKPLQDQSSETIGFLYNLIMK